MRITAFQNITERFNCFNRQAVNCKEFYGEAPFSSEAGEGPGMR